jgi:aminopeptidase N
MHVPQMSQIQPLPEDPVDRVDVISAEMQAAIAYFRSRFGDPPLRHIEVSPVPGRFGQGFAGMIYLPTLMYMDPSDVTSRAATAQIDEAFMGQLLRAHEVAHQWWGNIVTTDSYHHEWLMESLANYSAILFLESRMGPKAVEKALDVYRQELLVMGPEGATAESQGPVVEGRRLESSAVPNAANAVLYGKGTWIIHMLRRRMGDAGFMKMLAELRRRYEWKTITTDEFRQLCAEFLPARSNDPKLTDFFDQWVYDTGMPALKMTYSVVGTKLTGTITQTDVPDHFSVTVPVEIRAGSGKPIVKLVTTGGGPVKFRADVAGPGAKATLDPGWSVLRR